MTKTTAHTNNLIELTGNGSSNKFSQSNPVFCHCLPFPTAYSGISLICLCTMFHLSTGFLFKFYHNLLISMFSVLINKYNIWLIIFLKVYILSTSPWSFFMVICSSLTLFIVSWTYWYVVVIIRFWNTSECFSYLPKQIQPYFIVLMISFWHLLDEVSLKSPHLHCSAVLLWYFITLVESDMET